MGVWRFGGGGGGVLGLPQNTDPWPCWPASESAVAFPVEPRLLGAPGNGQPLQNFRLHCQKAELLLLSSHFSRPIFKIYRCQQG